MVTEIHSLTFFEKLATLFNNRCPLVLALLRSRLMCVTKKYCSLLMLLGSATFLVGQVPVPNRDKRTNPYSGNPNQQVSETVAQAEARDSFVDNRIYSDLFETGLPSFFREGNYRLRLNPKFGDFFDDDYIRFPVGLEYSFSDNFEGIVDVGTYFPNPFNSGGGWGSHKAGRLQNVEEWTVLF